MLAAAYGRRTAGPDMPKAGEACVPRRTTRPSKRLEEQHSIMHPTFLSAGRAIVSRFSKEKARLVIAPRRFRISSHKPSFSNIKFSRRFPLPPHEIPKLFRLTTATESSGYLFP